VSCSEKRSDSGHENNPKEKQRTVAERREGDRSKLATFKPVNSSRINRNSFLGRDVGTKKYS
jgi:hypothetical protein